MELKYPIVRPTLRPFDEILPLWREAWESGSLTVGRFNRLLEQAVCERTGAGHAVAVNSATSGLMMVLRAFGCTGEVVLPSFTFTASGHAVVWNNLTPVFAEIDPHTWTLDPKSVAEACSERTSAIMAVDIFSLPADYDALAEVASSKGLRLLVDSAQALGARYKGRMVGAFGDAQVFSLSPTKVVVGAEGGIVTTNDAALADELRSMRDYGKGPDGMDIVYFGLSARLSELHAAAALTNFRHMEDLVAARNAGIAYYKERLQDLPGVSFQRVPEGSRMAGIYMNFLVDRDEAGISRDDLARRLSERGIATKKFFYPPLHLQTAYRRLRQTKRVDLTTSERVSKQDLAIPLYAHMQREEMDEIVAAVREAFYAR